jgi:3-methyladenine DNA glycosylase AlkD
MTKDEVLAWIEKRGTKKTRDGMARYGIVAKHAFGVPVGTLHQLRDEIGRDQTLSLALWKTGCYEARLVAAFIGDPERVTRAQMNAWAKGFENWGDCDTVCFHLFDRSPHAWAVAPKWAASPSEFVRRGGYVLMACLAQHDKEADDEQFLPFLALIETGAGDERNFVKKGVNWALRSIGRRSPSLNKSATAVAKRLAKSEESAPRWVGKDALREFAKVKARASR